MTSLKCKSSLLSTKLFLFNEHPALSTAKPLPTEEEILARFHRLRITINLSATKFGYAVMGQPGLIRRLEEGKKLRVKGKRQCVEALDLLEREHSIPLPAAAGANVNGARTQLDTLQENIPSVSAHRSDMED